MSAVMNGQGHDHNGTGQPFPWSGFSTKADEGTNVPDFVLSGSAPAGAGDPRSRRKKAQAPLPDPLAFLDPLKGLGTASGSASAPSQPASNDAAAEDQDAIQALADEQELFSELLAAWGQTSIPADTLLPVKHFRVVEKATADRPLMIEDPKSRATMRMGTAEDGSHSVKGRTGLTAAQALSFAQAAMTSDRFRTEGVNEVHGTEMDKALLVLAAREVGMQINNQPQISADVMQEAQRQWDRMTAQRLAAEQFAAPGPQAAAAVSEAAPAAQPAPAAALPKLELNPPSKEGGSAEDMKEAAARAYAAAQAFPQGTRVELSGSVQDRALLNKAAVKHGLISAFTSVPTVAEMDGLGSSVLEDIDNGWKEFEKGLSSVTPDAALNRDMGDGRIEPAGLAPADAPPAGPVTKVDIELPLDEPPAPATAQPAVAPDFDDTLAPEDFSGDTLPPPVADEAAAPAEAAARVEAPAAVQVDPTLRQRLIEAGATDQEAAQLAADLTPDSDDLSRINLPVLDQVGSEEEYMQGLKPAVQAALSEGEGVKPFEYIEVRQRVQKGDPKIVDPDGIITIGPEFSSKAAATIGAALKADGIVYETTQQAPALRAFVNPHVAPRPGLQPS